MRELYKAGDELNPNWWKDFSKNRTRRYYWFNLNLDEVSLVSNVLYKQLALGRVKTVVIIVEPTDNKYTFIGIVSKLILNKDKIAEALKAVPYNKSNDWRNGA